MDLVLIDADFYAHKAYAVHKDFNVNGRGTGIQFGMINTLARIVRAHSTCDLHVCWGDRRSNLWRTKKFPAYKAHRTEHEADFGLQVTDTHNIISSLGAKQWLLPTWEADDVISHLARRYIDERGGIVYIYSNDHDMLQLASDRIRIIREKSKGQSEEFGCEEVVLKYGVLPEDLPRLFSYIGEKGDGIPGIPGIGPKRAAEILRGERPVPGNNMAEKLRTVKLVGEHIQLIRLMYDVPLEDNTLFTDRDPDYITQIAATLRFADRWRSNASKIAAFTQAARIMA